MEDEFRKKIEFKIAVVPTYSPNAWALTSISKNCYIEDT